MRIYIFVFAIVTALASLPAHALDLNQCRDHIRKNFKILPGYYELQGSNHKSIGLLDLTTTPIPPIKPVDLDTFFIHPHGMGLVFFDQKHRYPYMYINGYQVSVTPRTGSMKEVIGSKSECIVNEDQSISLFTRFEGHYFFKTGGYSVYVFNHGYIAHQEIRLKLKPNSEVDVYGKLVFRPLPNSAIDNTFDNESQATVVFKSVKKPDHF